MNTEYKRENNNYEIKLDIFEGPLDLLLHLIRKNEVDIFDIPIAVITDQYLEYMDIMKAFNMSIAGDFLVMASTLLHIKSRMLLPDLEDENEEDPREEITRPLLEYMQLKEKAEELEGRERLDRDIFTRRLAPDYFEDIQGENSHMNVTLFQLMDAFKNIVENRIPGKSLEVKTEEWSIKDKISIILDRLKAQKEIYFIELFNKDRSVSEFVVTFLALLEIVQLGLVRIFQTGYEKDIKLEGIFKDNGNNGNNANHGGNGYDGNDGDDGDDLNA